MSYHAAIIGLVNTLLAALIAFGVSLSEAQTTAVVGVVNAVLVLGSLVLQNRTQKKSGTNP
jgi:L-lactate permease